MISKEALARIDRAHSRADEAAQQLKDGHIITECIVLRQDERDGGDDVKLNMEQIEAWPVERHLMISSLHRRQDYSVVFLDTESDVRFSSYDFYDRAITDPYCKPLIESGRIMTKKSAAYLAAHPAPDPYTKSDRITP